MSGETKTTAQIAAETKAAFDKQIDAVKAIAEDALGKAAAGEKAGEDFKQKADEALSAMNATKARLDELEQKLEREGSGGDAAKSLGEQFVSTDEFKTFQASPRNGMRAQLAVKADITTSTTDAAGSVGNAIATTRLPGIQVLPQTRLTIRALLSQGRTDGPLLQYVQEKGFTNNAAMAAEGALKAQSDIQLIDKDVSTKVIAHWFRVSKQALSDVSQIRSLIDSRLLYGLQLKEEEQLLYGDGTGENLLGIVPQATAFDPAFTPDLETSIDRIRLAMLQAVLAEYPATGTVLHPTDWAGIELTKDTTGRHIIGNPQGTLAPTLWGLPIVATPKIAVGKFLTGAFQMGAQIFDQWDSRIEVGFQNDDFTRNKVTILAEERLALAVYRPEAFIYGDVAPAVGG